MTDHRIICGDSLHVLPTLDAESVDAIVCDPPYALTANKKGGSGAASVDTTTPYGRARIGTGNGGGGFMGMAWDSELPTVDLWREAWRVAKPGAHLVAFGGTRTYHRLACAIEDAGWEIRDCLSWLYGSGFPKSHNLNGDKQGWGTALKPAWEPIILARKPLQGTVASNVAQYGTGAINVDGCRIETSDDCARKPSLVHETAAGFGKGLAMGGRGHQSGRWPANVVLDEEAAALFPESRFFYVAKASRREREAGLEGMPEKVAQRYGEQGQGPTPQQTPRIHAPAANHHPTVKPIALMRWLCRLVTPPNGLVLDPFTGSGSTGCAAVLEGFRFVGVEREPEYAAIAEKRIAHWAGQRDEPSLFGG